MRKIYRLIACFLLVTILTTLMPMQVLAQGINSKTNKISTEDKNKKENTSSIKKILGEVEEKRESNVKHFLKENGTYEAVVYSQPVHYLEDGKWKDIDNTLIENGDIIANSQNDLMIKLSKKLEGNLVTIKQKNHEIGWSLVGGNVTNASIEPIDSEKVKNEINKTVDTIFKSKKEFEKLENKDKQNLRKILEENEKAKMITKNQSSMKYNDIFPNVDLQYILKGQSLKENIIINKKTNIPDIKFLLNLKNVNLKVEADNSIVFFNENQPSQTIFQMEAPFMYDSKGAISKNVNIKLEKEKDNYFLSLLPDENWLNSKDRVYPIVIDPYIIAPQYTIMGGFASNTTQDNKLVSASPITVGYDPKAYYTKKAFIKLPLPTLSSSDIVTKTELILTPTANPIKLGFGAIPLPEPVKSFAFHLNVRNVTSTWNWDTTAIPQYDTTTIASYANGFFKGDDGVQTDSIGSSTIHKSSLSQDNALLIDNLGLSAFGQEPVPIDITVLAKDWYNNKNYNGIEIESSGTLCSFIAPEDLSGANPYITLEYINNSGLESYWTYHSQELSRAGTGYTNDYTGNLVFVHDDLMMNGNRLPVDIKHIYNANIKTNIGYGIGWRLNLNQRVTVGSSNNYSYIYTDEDGTNHYIKNNNGVYNCATNPSIKFTVNSDGTYVINKNNNKLVFTSTGYLSETSDNNGNKSCLTYNGNILKSIKDGAGRTVTFDTDASGNLLGIVDPSGRRTSFQYTNGLLKNITYSDGKQSTYTYDTSHNLLTAQNYDGLKLSYTYSIGYGTHIASVNVSNGSTIGKQLNMTYGYNTTIFTDAIKRKTIYQFNMSGNTTCVIDEEGKAQYYQYNSSTDSNAVTLSSTANKTIVNHILNHSIETGDSWTINNGTLISSGSNTFATDDKYYGTKSLKIIETNAQNRREFSQQVSLIKGKSYTLSGYIKTKDVNLTTLNNGGASLCVTYKDLNGLNKIARTKFVSGNNAWDRYETNFTLPSDALSNTVSVSAEFQGATGTAYFDNLQLEEGLVSNRYNLVENCDFNYGSLAPNYWVKKMQCDANDKIISLSEQSPQALSQNSFRMNGSYATGKQLTQTINVSGKVGEKFVVGGWAKGKPVSSPSAQFHLSIGMRYTDGTYGFKYVNFNKDYNEWQYASDMMAAEKDFISVDVTLNYSSNENTAYFDGIQLYKEDFGTKYAYDANGNLTAVVDATNQASQYEYTNNDLTKVTENGVSTSANYDANHNLLSVQSTENVVSSFTYDSYGNMLTTKVGNDTLFTLDSSTYTTNGNYIKTSTDSSGNTTTYNYNEIKGVLDTVINAKNQVENYSYDNMDKLISVNKTVGNKIITNSYGYENDRLKTINHNNFNYNFGYDPFGNNTSISVGNQNIINNIFDSNTGRILESTYGNGNKVSYSYDIVDRITSRKYNGVEKFKYEYDSYGNIALLQDIEGGVKYRYTYDLSNRPIKKNDSLGNSTIYSYITSSGDKKITEVVNGQTFETNYKFNNDNKPSNVTYNRNSTNAVSYEYDILGRKLRNVVNTGSTTFNTNFEYTQGVNGATTDKISKVINNGEAIAYTYDKNNNIDTVICGDKKIKYYYDELNQLIREDNQVLNKTITYSYDGGGNLINKIEYAYTTTSPISPLKTFVYSYSDTNWKDKLTSFDGKDISYDSIGNPLTYDGYNFIWEEGRQLKALSKSGLNISYKYNDSGIRTEKSVNGVITKFHLDGDKVTYELKGNEGIYYTYDSEDKLISMNYKGQEYYYIRNNQEDIIGLFDGTGNKVASYVYDSWGKLINIKDQNGIDVTNNSEHVGNKNPYRYRGYRYDTETGLYYLQSRYYNPEWGRFVNADDAQILKLMQGQLHGANMFAYCFNNPVMGSDPEGYAWWNNTRNYLRSRDFVSGVINFALGVIFGGVVGGGIIKALKKRVAQQGRAAAKEYLSYELRRQLKKSSLKATTQVAIVSGAIKLVDMLNNILNPGGWIFDNWLDRDRNGLLD